MIQNLANNDSFPLQWRVSLGAAIVDVFAQPLAALTGQAAELTKVLSDGEREDAQRRLHREGAHGFVLARGWLRLLMTTHLAARGVTVSPSELPFRRASGGKPELALPGVTLHFNISHGGDWVAVGLCREAGVGIDVEGPRVVDDALGIARRWFPQDEIDALEATADTAARQTLFIDLWRMKEAVSKAHGRGMSLGLGIPVLAAHRAFLADAQTPSYMPAVCDGGRFHLARPLTLPATAGQICVAVRAS